MGRRRRAAALEVPGVHGQLLFTGADMMHARAEGRREATAITWGTTCLGCLGRSDSLYAERDADTDDAVRANFADLHATYAETGDRALKVDVSNRLIR